MDPYGGIKLTIAWGCSTGPSGYIGLRGGWQPYAMVDFIPQKGTMNLATGLEAADTIV